MGGQQSESSSLKFVQLLQDRRFGSIRVYREEQKPYGYYMKLTVDSQGQGGDQRQIQRIVETIEREQCREFFPRLLQPLEAVDNCGVSCYGLIIEYQNHTLRDFCQGLQDRSDSLAEEEICYIVQTAIAIEKVALKNGLAINVSVDQLFVTPQGTLIVYPFGLLHELSHSEMQSCNSLCVDPTNKMKLQQPTKSFFHALASTLRCVSFGSLCEREMNILASKICSCRSVDAVENLHNWATLSNQCLVLPMNRNSLFVKQLAQRSRHSSFSGTTSGSSLR